MVKLTKAMKAMTAKAPTTKTPMPLAQAIEILKGLSGAQVRPERRNPHALGNRPSSG